MTKRTSLKYSGLVAILFMWLVGFTAFAQQPVQVTALLRAPYSLQLSDYYASTQEKLVVVLTNRDLNKPLVNVRLRMNIESQTVQLHSREFATYPTIQLEAGVPLRLSLSDLAPYFNPDNLDFSGMTRAQYLQQAKLPDGFYQFCFEAIEVSTGQVASAKACAMAWISLSDPPLLNIPQKGEAIAFKEPQNIIFQWTPRHLNSPNAAYATEYDFQLVELWDNTLAPEVAFQSMQPLYEVTTRTTTLLYGPSQPLMIAGKRYGWRVKARARSGVEEVDVFRNQGYSEIYWFTYQDMCPAPVGVNASTKTFGNVEFSWMGNIRHSSYLVTYRQKDKDNATWFDQSTPTSPALVFDVQPGIEYEYRVAAFCNTDQPVFSEIHTVKLPARDSTSFANCSIIPDPQITNKEILKTLKTGETIKAGDFPVKITEVSGSSPYTGKGYVVVPFLGSIKVPVTFDNIQVNTDKQLIAGTIVTTYEKAEGGIVDIDKGLDYIRDYPGIVSRLESFTADTDEKDLKGVVDKVVEQAGEKLPQDQAEKVKTNAKELLEAKKTYDKAKAESAALPASDPKKKELDKKVEEAKQKFEEIQSRFEGLDKDAVSTDPYTVKFNNPVNLSTLSFDTYKYAGTEGDYEVVKQGADKYYIPWKAVAQGEYDWVGASPMNLVDIMSDSVEFRSTTGKLESKKMYPRETHVKVHGLGPGETSLIVAYEKKKINNKAVNVELGRLNVVSYTKLYKKVVIVLVNNPTLPGSKEAIQTGIKKVYSPALVEWNVEWKSITSNFDAEGNGMKDDLAIAAFYNADMRQVLTDYGTKEGFNSDVHYVFIVPKGESGKWGGFNPFSRPAAFVFAASYSAVDGIVQGIAHEMGHGAFRLTHTFASLSDALSSVPKGSTDNLMDYSNSTSLFKYQWDQIHSEPIVIPLIMDQF